MPIYEFQCHDCQKKFETLLASSRKINEVVCPQCHGKNLKKIISATSNYGFSKPKTSIPAGALSGCSSRGGFS